MGQRLNLLDGVLTVRLDGHPDSATIAADIRAALDGQPLPVYVILDFTHTTAVDQTFKAAIFRGLQHVKVAPRLGIFGLNRAIIDDAKMLMTALANTRKVIVRDSELEVRDALGLSLTSRTEHDVPKLAGLLNFARKSQIEQRD